MQALPLHCRPCQVEYWGARHIGSLKTYSALRSPCTVALIVSSASGTYLRPEETSTHMHRIAAAAVPIAFCGCYFTVALN